MKVTITVVYDQDEEYFVPGFVDHFEVKCLPGWKFRSYLEALDAGVTFQSKRNSGDKRFLPTLEECAESVFGPGEGGLYKKRLSDIDGNDCFSCSFDPLEDSKQYSKLLIKYHHIKNSQIEKVLCERCNNVFLEEDTMASYTVGGHTIYVCDSCWKRDDEEIKKSSEKVSGKHTSLCCSCEEPFFKEETHVCEKVVCSTCSIPLGTTEENKTYICVLCLARHCVESKKHVIDVYMTAYQMTRK